MIKGVEFIIKLYMPIAKEDEIELVGAMKQEGMTEEVLNEKMREEMMEEMAELVGNVDGAIIDIEGGLVHE